MLSALARQLDSDLWRTPGVYDEQDSLWQYVTVFRDVRQGVFALLPADGNADHARTTNFSKYGIVTFRQVD